MVQKKDIPSLTENTRIYDAIYPISSAGLGLTMINKKNKIVGIFTDGDLRRCLEKKIDISKITLAKVMTRDFKFIDENEFLSKAISQMERYKVFSLLVKNTNGKVIGLLRMHDLLKAKII